MLVSMTAPSFSRATHQADRLASTAPDLGSLEQSARDSARVIQALSFLGEEWRAQPDYAAAAARIGLSPHHFHKLFSRWVGLSPKRYVQAIAQAEARAALEAGASVEEAAWDAGFSGPSRLHDVFIAHEAVTPGQARRRGAGLSFIWGCAPTPFGSGVFLIAERGLAGLAFADAGMEDEAFADLAQRFSAAIFTRDDDAARAWAHRIFVASEGPLPLVLHGTPWQRQVWRALLAIEPGGLSSYSDIASQVCTPKASRAVGAAVGANPISWIIPCHRVLATDGRLTGYHWGVERKRAMLAFEALHAGTTEVDETRADG